MRLIWQKLRQMLTAGQKLPAGLHNLLNGVWRTVQRLPRNWRYYSLPMLVLVLGVLVGYGRSAGLFPLDLREGLKGMRGNIIQPQESDLFSQHIINLEGKTASELGEPDAPVEPASPGTAEVPSAPAAARLPVSLGAGTLAAPVAGEVLSGFGMVYSRTYADWRYHPGFDYAAAVGETACAGFAGLVESVEKTPDLDWVIVLDHGDGLKTIYGNCAAALVKAGQAVGQGDAIGTVGSAGMAELADGCHLHFAVMRDGEAIDPAPYLQQP